MQKAIEYKFLGDRLAQIEGRYCYRNIFDNNWYYPGPNFSGESEYVGFSFNLLLNVELEKAA